MTTTDTFTLFQGHRQRQTGDLPAVAGAAVALVAADVHGLLIMDDQTGQAIELDLRQDAAFAVSSYRPRNTPEEMSATRQGRGRPKLGVVAREVTLLPRHWDWLADQPGGASAALRRLVEDARRQTAEPERTRRHREAVYRAMSTLAGDQPGFDEAARALFAGDSPGFEARISDWPSDLSAYLLRLLQAPQG